MDAPDSTYPKMMYVYDDTGQVTGSLVIQSADEMAETVASLPDEYEVSDAPPPVRPVRAAEGLLLSGTRRGDQITAVGRDILLGGLMPEEVLDLVLRAVVTWAAGYRPDLGHGVRRRLKIEEVGDDYVDVSVHLTGYQEVQNYYRLAVNVTELNHP